MKKVYISKSKNSNYDDLLKLRSELRKFDDIEIVEFTGGTYSTKQLESCDYCIVVPPNQTNTSRDRVDDLEYIVIGKGQYCEIECCGDNDKPMWLFFENKLFEINGIDEFDYSTDFNRWATLAYCFEYSKTLNEVFLNRLSRNVKECNLLDISQNKKLLLIKR